MLKRTLQLIAIGAVFGLTIGGVTADQAAAQSHSTSIPEIEWDTTLTFFQFDQDKFIGQRLTAKCPPAPAQASAPGIYGTDVYPSDNAICPAALHAGKMQQDGGVVTVQLNPGASGYTGSSRHGVNTSDLPATPRSMVFVDGDSSNDVNQIHQAHAPRIKWDTKFTATGFAHRHLIGQRFTFNCPAAPANLRPRRVVGTDSYAFHSMVCRAAVHAGKMTMDGGLVTVQMDPGMPKLVGSIRHGIETKNGSGGHRTISFVDNPALN